MRLSLLASVLAILLLPVPLCAQSSRHVVPDSPKGFDQQYKRIFNAFADGNAQKMDRSFAEFALPPHWFIDVFGPDQGPQLAEQYSELFQGFVSTTKNEFNSVPKWLTSDGCGKAGDFDCRRISTKPVKTKTAIQADPKPEPASLFPLPRVQRFKVRYQSGPYRQDDPATSNLYALVAGENDTWVDSFVYVDGAFRFFGGDVYPFWNPCSRNRVRPGGELITKVELVYPSTAPPLPSYAVGYVVEMRVTVTKDGSVKDAEALDGDGSFLADSAREAVLQWHYKPFTNCGVPIEKRVEVPVTFALK